MPGNRQTLGEWITVRPSFLALVALVIGILVGYRGVGISNPPTSAILLSAFVVATASLFFQRLIFVWVLLFVAFAFTGLALTLDSFNATAEIVATFKKQVIQATVARILANNNDHRIVLLKSGYLSQINKTLQGYGRLSLRENGTTLVAGDRISFRSNIRTPINRGNPGEYDWETDCKSEGIAWLANVRGSESLVLIKSGWPFCPSALLSQLRQAMSSFIEKNSGTLFNDVEASAIRAIHKGIILGDRAEISSDLNKAFSNSGLVHMLSASGSHVTIVAAMTFFVIKTLVRIAPNIMLWIPLPKIAAFFCIPAVSVYCLLVGLKPPAMRAGIVGVTLAMAFITERRWDSLNSLAFSAIVILFFYPLSIFTPSFQLSFAAVAGILLIVQSSLFRPDSKPLRDFQTHPNRWFARIREKSFLSTDAIKRPVMSLVVSSLAATMAITPLIIHIFHSIPIYSIPANLASDFPLTLGLSIGLLSTIIGVANPTIGQWLMVPADFFVWLVIKVAVVTAKLPWATLQIPNLGYLGLLLSFITTCITFYYIIKPTRSAGLVVGSSWMALVAALMIGQFVQNSSDKLRLVFLNVGNGDCAYIKAPGASGMFVDMGPKTPYFDTGQSIITPFLLWQTVHQLKGIIVSHAESDHMGGTLTTVRNFSTGRLFINPVESSHEYARELVSFAGSHGIRITPADSSVDRISVGEARITFLHPNPSFIRKKLNDMSAVARLDYRNFSVLFTGDLEKEGERELMNSGAMLKATILKIPHHGGKTSATSQCFLSSILPKIAVLSADYPPRAGLPNFDVLTRLNDVGAEFFWTGRDGAITIETDGVKSIVVVTGKDNRKTFFPIALDNLSN
ncbi:MAG: DNA internalization-related competence protein ComEC/Rec2 [Deltaproteobacteria bacterium]|nr:DNA internalization-related competence protein ComEC/Rec2 [Deltaproteobacteria bacterium]